MNSLVLTLILIISIINLSFCQEWTCSSESTENEVALFVGQTTRQMAI